MARRGKNNRTQRDTRSIATRSVLVPSPISDLRLFTPDPYISAKDLRGRPAYRLDVPRSVSPSPRRLPSGVAFASPQNMMICVRRKTRKQVLHALKKTGAGSRKKIRRRNEWSDIRCR